MHPGRIIKISSCNSSIFIYIFVLFFHLNVITFTLFKIDKAKFGKSKYNYNKRIESHWVLGMTDTEINYCRIIVVENITLCYKRTYCRQREEYIRFVG